MRIDYGTESAGRHRRSRYISSVPCQIYSARWVALSRLLLYVETNVRTFPQGISGLAALKECLQAGLDAQVFEARPEVGGAWAYEPCSFDSGRSDVHSSVYQGTILNSCRDTTSFTDFPFDPARYGDYFGHKQMLQYLHEYAEQFDLKKHIRFQTRVLDCRPRGFGKDGWDVTVQRIDMAPEQAIFTAVLACTGHVSRPKTPAFKNRESFQGKFFHSHLYRTPGPFEGKRVAIIGLGSSAVDIACEVAPQAEDLHIITRRGGWILPRYVLGKPTEAWDSTCTSLSAVATLTMGRSRDTALGATVSQPMASNQIVEFG